MRLSNIALYDKNTTDFFDQGLGILSDAISSESTEEVQDNGNITYEMVLKYPIDGVLSDKLKLPNLIRAQESEDPNDFMIFEIYDYDEDDEGEMTVYAQAMPYRVLRLPFNDDSKFPTQYKNIQELMDYAVSRVTGFPSWFKITSDIIVADNLSFDAGNAQFENLGKFLDATLGLIDASVEYQWNRINILDSRGRDLSDIVLRDDKNTNGVKITGSYEKIINKVVPIIRNRNDKTGEFEDGTHMGSVVTSKDPFKWIPYYAGVTAAFDSQEEANNYISSNKLDNPAITVDVSPLMVDEDLTQVHTFDRITAYSTKLKYQDTLQVTTRVFDQLNAEVVSFKMGSIKKDINSTTSYTLSSLASEIARAQNVASSAAMSADGKNKVYFPGSNPTSPSEGDLWFHKVDGKDVGEQYINGEWVTIIKDSMGNEIQSYVDQKVLENNQVMADLDTNLKSNAQTIKDNKQAVDDAMGKVNENLTQAQADVEKAVKNADLAVANAQSAVDASGLATTTANAASDAALAAKDLATSTSNSFAAVKSQADTAANDAANAIGAANKAQGDATSALGNSNTAISNAKDALNKVNGMNVGGTNLLLNTGDLSANWIITSISTTTEYDGHPSIVFPSTPSAWKLASQMLSLGKLQNSTQYSVGFWAKADNAGDKAHTELWGGNGATDFVLTTNWVRYTAVVTSYSDANTSIEQSSYYLGAPVGNTGNVYIALPKLEKGNLATDWSPSPEDVQIQINKVNGELSQKVSQTDYDTLTNQVTDNTSQLKLTATAASLEVTSKKVDALNKTVSDNSAQLKLTATSAALETQSQRVDTISGQVDTNTAGITAANGAIELKASNSRVDTLSNTVEQQGIDLKAAQGELKLKLTQSDLTKGLDGYATQTWAQNQINASAKELSSTMTTVQAQVQNSAVGTNLLRNSKGKFQPNRSATDNYLIYYDSVVYMTQGQQYTVHADTSSGLVWSSYHDGNVERNRVALWLVDNKTVNTIISDANTSTGTTFTWNSPSGTYCLRVNTYKPDNSGYAENVKIEKGNLATDWCPNPADNATVTALSQLSQTVEGLTGTFATKNDLENTESKFKVTADGLNLITAVTGTNGEKVTQVIADVKNIKTTMTGENGYTTRLQTLEGFQQTASSQIAGKAEQTQVTQLADQYNVISGSISNPNLVLNSGLPTDTSSWLDASNLTIGKHRFYRGGRANAFYINNATTIEKTASTNRFKVTPGQRYTLTFKAFASGNSVNQDVFFLGRSASSTASSGYDKVMLLINQHRYSPTGIESAKVAFTVPDGVDEGYIRFDNNGSTDGNNSAFYFTEIKVEAGTLATPWEADSNYSQLLLLQDQLDLRVTVSNKITAALSLSADGGGTVTIRGASLYVTADSHFDNASIQSAAIASLDATKITSGSISSDRLATTSLNADNITSGSIAAERLATTKLNADNITSGSINAELITTGKLSADRIWGGTLNGYLMDIVNINANNITTGTISGANLAINLTSGEVLFTKGSIKSTTGTLDIEIEDGTFSQRNNLGAGFLMSQGNLYFSATSFWEALDKNEYALSTLVPDYGYLGFGDVIATKRGMALHGKDALSLGLIDTRLTVDYFDNTQGFISIQKDESMTVNGGRKGLILVGGTTKTGMTMPTSPSIFVGSNTTGDGSGNRIYVDAEYFHVPTVYKHTASGSANVIVKADGALVRTSSATKYKSDITRFRSTEMADKLIRLPQAHWYNKEDMKRYNEDPDHYYMPEMDYGMIAEDIAGAGLEDLVVRGDDGELEDVRYDRMAAVLLPLIASMKQEIEELKGEK